MTTTIRTNGSDVIIVFEGRLNTATSMERSKLLGSISPAHEGTVGFLPFASLTYAVIPLERTNSNERPPNTKTSLGDNLSTNFSDSSPATEP